MSQRGAGLPPTTESPARRELHRAQQKTTRLGVLLVVVSTLILVELLPSLEPGRAPFHVEWWMLAAGFALTELAVFHIEINREAHTFSLSEIPTVIGLLFGLPFGLILGRLVGETLTLVLRDHQPLPKLVFNLSMFLAECTAALAVFHLVHGTGDVTTAGSWAAVAAAVFVADTVSILCVLLAIRWHGSVPEPKKLFAIGTLTAIVNTTIAVTASLLLVVNRLSALLLLLIVAVVYVTYRSYSNLIQRHSDLRMLYDFTTVVSRTVHAEEVLEELLGQAQKLLRAEYAEVEIDDADGKPRRIGRGRVPPAEPTGDAFRTPVHAGGNRVMVSRSTKDETLRAYADSRGFKDLILATLSGDGRVIGTILVANRLGEVSSFDEGDARLFETFVNHASVALENGRLVDRLSDEVREREHQATHDALTELPNRLLFFRRVSEHIEGTSSDRRDPFAVMLMDLDRFKEVNDTLGHHAGDLVLKEVARRLRAALPEEVTIARLGGDEFALVLPHCDNTDANNVATRVLEYLVQPCYVEGMMVDVGASIGVSLFPRHGVDPPSLLKHADIAMYNAKASAEHVAFYDVDGDAHSPRRLALTSALRETVEARNLDVHYQPKVRLNDGAPTGVEALIRWHHPDLGRVRPDEFIPIAEQTGLVIPLTWIVLERALADARRWREKGYDLSVAVNVSVRSLADGGFVDSVAALLAASGTPPERLILEVTETGVMTDPRRTITTLEALDRLGVRTSVDDFGTGYSSLAYLQRLPVHEVKIDRSFVMTMAVDRNSAAIVRSIIDLGRNLGLDIVAEGVEDDAVLPYLHRLGCTYAQGYAISRPVPFDVVSDWLAARLVGTAA